MNPPLVGQEYVIVNKNMKPFGKRIHIKPEEENTFIKSSDNTKIVRGVAVAVGPECTSVKAGDKVIFTAWGVDEVNINGEKLYFLIESDEFILATE